MSAAMPLPHQVAMKSVADRATHSEAGGTISFGKYREIIIAVALFLVFDLGVLVLNFYTSYQIAEDAIGINLSGRQRMLSQRTAKAILSLESAHVRGADTSADTAELRKAVELFDATLNSFQHGGTVPGGDGQPVFLPAVHSAAAQSILTKTQGIWTPYLQLLNPLVYGRPFDTDILAAAQYARANNLAVLGLMNELTTTLEAVASNRANTLRLVQTCGIVLALLNFAFILFKFLRRLRTSDAAVEAANEENREILSSVREGLFLITANFKIGSQVSESAHTLFGQPLCNGDSFFSLLAPLVNPTVQAEARDYVDLLFSAHIKESLVRDINPLQKVQVKFNNRLGHDTERYLTFHFNRVQVGNVVRHLLVTVQDVTEQMALQTELLSERQRSQKEFNMLLKAFDAEPALLRQFVARSELGLLEINEQLRATSMSHGEGPILAAMEQAWRRIHALKGDAATLGLQTLADQAHVFETELARLRNAGGTTGKLGDALLGLPMQLEDLLAKVALLKNLTQARTAGASGSAMALNDTLVQLSQRVASGVGKRVTPQINLQRHSELPPAAQDLVREIAVQLIRNAVVHGIEAPSSRIARAKTDTGTLEVTLLREGDEWCLRVRDDGAGLSAARIRQKLLDKHWYTPEQMAHFSDPQIVSHIFKPGFSTVDVADEHAGRGVGLDVVYANVQQLGAHLMLTSTAGQFTQFAVRFAA